MGKKINPEGLRLGITKIHESLWYADKSHYSNCILEDFRIREWINKNLKILDILNINIDRLNHFKEDKIIVCIKISEMKRLRSLSFISSTFKGINFKYLKSHNVYKKYIDKLIEIGQEIKKEFLNYYKRKFKELLNIELILVHQKPSFFYASSLANQMVHELEKRIPYKQVLTKTISSITQLFPDLEGEKKKSKIIYTDQESKENRLYFPPYLKQDKKIIGIKAQISGRLDGHDIARSEWLMKGRIPLNTLKKRIQYSEKPAYTKYGTVGVKVWLLISYRKFSYKEMSNEISNSYFKDMNKKLQLEKNLKKENNRIKSSSIKKINNSDSIKEISKKNKDIFEKKVKSKEFNSDKIIKKALDQKFNSISTVFSKTVKSNEKNKSKRNYKNFTEKTEKSLTREQIEEFKNNPFSYEHFEYLLTRPPIISPIVPVKPKPDPIIEPELSLAERTASYDTPPKTVTRLYKIVSDYEEYDSDSNSDTNFNTKIENKRKSNKNFKNKHLIDSKEEDTFWNWNSNKKNN